MKENNEFLLNKVIQNSTINAMKGSFSEKFDFILRKSSVGDCKNHFNRNESLLVDKKVRKLFTGTEHQNLWTEEYRKKFCIKFIVY
jgi:hypothetical protein